MVGALLDVEIDELQRRCRLFQHAPALEPGVGALHLGERDWRRIADHDAAFAQVLRAQRADLDRKSTRLNSSHIQKSRMPSSA